ncbi:hypothetical protein [Desulfonema magnum]|uniref:Uncharacterized protein n=1 Tax=Desulfonema magnum TaxID=45655 RepID=A0A975BLK1_9BACT|nr:hypothetical protein [Desulfonema magnum]QTA87348.1 Uncharacterized protein dnm_033800 [Desulfonema magnum]
MSLRVFVAKNSPELFFKHALKDTKRLREPSCLRVFVAKNSPELFFKHALRATKTQRHKETS